MISYAITWHATKTKTVEYLDGDPHLKGLDNTSKISLIRKLNILNVSNKKY